jgi:hypothetical protein
MAVHRLNPALRTPHRKSLKSSAIVLNQTLNEIVIADGFDQEMLSWFAVGFDDQVLLSAFRHYNIDLPVGFAKDVLSLIFQKPKNVESAKKVKDWNLARKAEVIEKYGAKW